MNNPVRYNDPTGHCDIDQCPSTYAAWTDTLNAAYASSAGPTVQGSAPATTSSPQDPLDTSDFCTRHLCGGGSPGGNQTGVPDWNLPSREQAFDLWWQPQCGILYGLCGEGLQILGGLPFSPLKGTMMDTYDTGGRFGDIAYRQHYTREEQYQATINSGIEFGLWYAFAGVGGAGRAPVGPAPDFVVTENGCCIPVPKGATGPYSTWAPGIEYRGGSGLPGFPKSTAASVRIMDPTEDYLTGYVHYKNAGGTGYGPQAIDPYTSQTVGRSDLWWHYPLP